jgi:hypothetical protein
VAKKYFVVEESGLSLNDLKMKCYLRKQLILSAGTKAIQSGVEATDTSAKYVMIFLFIQNILLKGSVYLVLDCVRSLQMILHLPMMANVFPGNLLMINTMLIELVMFDVLPSEQSVDLVFSYNQTKIEEV